MTLIGPAERLRPEHELDAFDCGKEDLNRFLTRHALNNQKAQSAVTYVICRAGAVRGYYSLTVASVKHDEASERVRKGMPRYPIPVMLLARLAIDLQEPSKGLGSALLKDAMLRTARAADIAGVRALLVHAKDDAARAFYERFDFDPSPTDPYHLFLLTKDLNRLIP